MFLMFSTLGKIFRDTYIADTFLFSGKNKKNILICRLLKILPGMLSLKEEIHYLLCKFHMLIWICAVTIITHVRCMFC